MPVCVREREKVMESVFMSDGVRRMELLVFPTGSNKQI